MKGMGAEVRVGEDNRKQFASAMTSAIGAALEEIGLLAEGYAKKLCPVDTGRLRNSITHEVVSGREVHIGTSVEYAPYVELGTRKQHPSPYLKPAAQDHASQYRSVLKKRLEG